MAGSKPKTLLSGMKFFNLCFFSYLIVLFAGCSILKKNILPEMENGQYKIRSGVPAEKVYAVFEDSAIRLYPFVRPYNPDSSAAFLFIFNETEKNVLPLRIKKSSLDIDILTIPFKYRPSLKIFPNQLNTNFNGALFVGYRSDNYHFHYIQNPLRQNQRKVDHFGYSLGVFAGFGSTAMNPWVTQNSITSEYDGLVLLKGIAGILAIRSFTFGIGVGLDHLIDRNKKLWIYQGKPWIGLTVGLNLN